MSSKIGLITQSADRLIARTTSKLSIRQKADFIEAARFSFAQGNINRPCLCFFGEIDF